MRYRSFVSMLLGLLALLFLMSPASAGGWVVVTLDALPTEIHAGEPLTLGFTLLQHGQRPVHEIAGQPLEPYLSAWNVEQGETLRVEARPDGKEGHFVLEVTFPTEGNWEWEINPVPFAGRTTLQPITVLPAAPVSATTSIAGESGTLQLLLRGGGLLLLLVAAGLALAARRTPGPLPELQPERSHG